MKKLIYSFMLVLFVTVVFSSCTKEEVKPAGGNSSGGAGLDKGV